MLLVGWAPSSQCPPSSPQPQLHHQVCTRTTHSHSLTRLVWKQTNKLEEFSQEVLESHLLCLISDSLEIIKDWSVPPKQLHICRKQETMEFVQINLTILGNNYRICILILSNINCSWPQEWMAKWKLCIYESFILSSAYCYAMGIHFVIEKIYF